ncbi:hypothetical protein E2C01_083041 [Portunus trituberculatus]|uniref:Uncharacterized protein n=1 Tax=Portunus trituberculatus TaxID=210409 RepID=A0A5B7J5C8_PORTR|nr:hypothetical protein [Portunus trituberculatus]
MIQGGQVIPLESEPVHSIQLIVRKVQFNSEGFNPCSPGASQDYPHGFILNKFQGTEFGDTKLY